MVGAKNAPKHVTHQIIEQFSKRGIMNLQRSLRLAFDRDIPGLQGDPARRGAEGRDPWRTRWSAGAERGSAGAPHRCLRPPETPLIARQSLWSPFGVHLVSM